MLRVSAQTKVGASTKGILQESASTQKATSPTVVEHVLSRLKDLGITKVFGVAGGFAFPIGDAIVGYAEVSQKRLSDINVRVPVRGGLLNVGLINGYAQQLA